ncbi:MULTISPECIES: DUF6286 domain-containing protein [Prauserella salsuginis group]|uniref:DUF6286 domain-containing protein n=2 Tax=Prauserella salsuginis group TaxID=2893672 RepID=A0A839XK87_9PSEU|nr:MULTISPECIES: DUF6286 domain-containing protein [Prauserella salsuginis group]MBB3663171.1 hypothetical protein [Prauserella sediminis]MCR3721002.1 hypothetical protein [Prauserella flava]MCR3734917.1 hypothetical protein [Prauserella salsuginis]
MKRRPRRSLPALLVALVVLAAGALVAITAVQLLLGEPPWISYDAVARTLHGLRWADTAVLLVGIGTALVGLLLLLCAFVPGARTVLPLAPGDSGVDCGAAQRSYRNVLHSAAARVDGVSDVKVKARSRSVKAVVRTDRTNTAGLTEAVERALAQRIDQLAPERKPTVKSKLKAARSK